MRKLSLAMVAVAALVFSEPVLAQERSEPIVVESGALRFIVDAPEGMERFAEMAAEVVEDNWPLVATAAGVGNVVPERGGEITVSVEREIDDWFVRRDVPPRNPEWAAGLAIYSESAVIIRSANPEWESTLAHELAHMAVDVASGGRRVPRWFNEGFAVATAEQWSIERATTMISAGLSGNFYDFDELTNGFPAAASSAGLAYAQSFHFVQYITKNYGDGVFVGVMRRLREDGAEWNVAFEAEAGIPLAAAEALWVSHVSTRYKWAPAIGGGGGAWGAIAALSLVAWRRKKRSAVERLAALGASEAQLFSPDPDDKTFG
ncbi:MAG: hypothetical protein ACJAYU_001387 [Bradymonadia bacterium]|jgi:hypothetical protein